MIFQRGFRSKRSPRFFVWEIQPVWGDEIGVFNSKNELVGSGVYQDANMAITVWGIDGSSTSPDGLTKGEEMTFKIYSAFDKTTSSFTVTSWLEGDGNYKSNGISIIDGIDCSILKQESRLLQNYPNPFKDVTLIRFYLANNSNVVINIANIEGKIIRSIDLGTCNEGNNVYKFSSDKLPNGLYYYTLKAEDFTGSGKMVIIK